MIRTILLVDDEPMVAEELQEALEFEGFAVDAATSVVDAMEACGNKDYDLIITDLKMPQLTGLDLLRALQEFDDPPVIFVLSGHGAESNRVEATDLGASQCFSKPVDPDFLVSKIEAALH